MTIEKNKEDSIPYFSWDRRLTEREIKDRLKNLEGMERDKLVAWILREAAFKDVWDYLKLQVVCPGFRIP